MVVVNCVVNNCGFDKRKSVSLWRGSGICCRGLSFIIDQRTAQPGFDVSGIDDALAHRSQIFSCVLFLGAESLLFGFERFEEMDFDRR